MNKTIEKILKLYNSDKNYLSLLDATMSVITDDKLCIEEMAETIKNDSTFLEHLRCECSEKNFLDKKIQLSDMNNIF